MVDFYERQMTHKKISLADGSLLQVAALPYRYRHKAYEVLLITSRERQRWIVPKGWPQKGKTLSQSAATEALEEAGVYGTPSTKPIGNYTYQKIDRHSLSSKTIRVDLFPLLVAGQINEWKEKGQRYQQWYSPEQAALLLSDVPLAQLMLNFFHRLQL